MTEPTAIDFESYTDDINMRNIADNVEMMSHGEDHSIASPRIGYVGSAESFASRDMDSEGTSTIIIEEEQSVRGHNFNNSVEVVDYTTTTVPTTVTTTTTLDDGFTAVRNGSPTRNSLRERHQARITNNNPYFVLGTGTIKNKLNHKNVSAKTDLDNPNE